MTTQHAKSNAREGDGVGGLPAKWRAFADNPLLLGAERDMLAHCTSELEAAMQAQQGAEPVACHRTITPTGPWQWMDGPPSLGALDNLKVFPSWRIEYAYARTGAPR